MEKAIEKNGRIFFVDDVDRTRFCSIVFRFLNSDEHMCRIRKRVSRNRSFRIKANMAGLSEIGISPECTLSYKKVRGEDSTYDLDMDFKIRRGVESSEYFDVTLCK